MYERILETKIDYFFDFKKLKGTIGHESPWYLTWSSTGQIDYNKRMFIITVASLGKGISRYKSFGMPTPQYLEYCVKRCCAYQNITKKTGIKPYNNILTN